MGTLTNPAWISLWLIVIGTLLFGVTTRRRKHGPRRGHYRVGGDR